MSIDAIFDGRYESAIIFGENIYIKNENRKIRVHFGMYNSRHFNNFIGNNCSNYTHKCSFS
jgi:hypothetical protein